MKTLATILVLATLHGAAAHAEPRGAAPRAAAPDTSRAVRVTAATPVAGELALARAAAEQRRGNPRGVVEALETIDFARGPAFAGADRAAFLLSQAYAALGERARLEALADVVARWHDGGAYARWVAFERRFGPGAAPVRAGDGLDPADRSPLALYAGALQSLETGADDPMRWEAVAETDTASALGRDLAGAAALHRAAVAFARGEDGRAWLVRVPAGSRWATRARHLRGLACLERGDAAAGVALLELALADSGYGARREVLQALAGAALDRGDWTAARTYGESADHEWNAQREALRRWQSTPAPDSVWAAWQARPDSSEAWVLDAAPVAEQAARFSDASADLTASWGKVVPMAATVARSSGAVVAVEPPSPEQWTAVSAGERALAERRAERERTRWALEHEAASLADQRRYLGIGRDGAAKSAAELDPALARLAQLRGSLDTLDARLRALRDAEGRRLAARLDSVSAAAARQSLWLQGMQRLYVAGPDSARQRDRADGAPGPGRVVAAEQALTASLASEAERMHAAMPALLARSYEQAWGPKLVDRIVAQTDEAGRQSRWAGALVTTLDSSITAAGSSPLLAQLHVRMMQLDATADSLAAAQSLLRAAIARDAVGRTLAAIDREREGIDYDLAASAYALAVRLSPRDSALASASVATNAPSPAGAAGEEDDREDPEAARWRNVALPAMQAFLAAHPQSGARAEVRFRLADLELLAARQAFREQMAAFLHPADGRVAHGAVPLLDPHRALALYRQILAEDPQFAHLDAVRFNAGMILADAGDPEARRFFHDLVTLHPGSAYEQEAWLRMGDMAFNEKRFPESVELYGHAAAGADPTLAAIAGYKLGWAHFNQDRFLAAADAFRSVLDLYAAHRGQVGVDIEGEADAYLVHSLAGAGGASAFATYFDRIGHRPYEKHLLMALGQHFRRYGKFPEAAATDELVLTRFVGEPEALVAAQRLVETHQRSNHPALVSEARHAFADRFAPGGAWWTAQTSDSARAAGAAFARTSYLGEAYEHHERARANGGADEWRAARDAYQNVLAHWPDDPDAARFRLGAGEACLRLADYPGALQQFAAAERSGHDSLVTVARLQRVAATDAWYESSRSGRATGSDSLAHLVLKAGDAFIGQEPANARGADILWRMSQLSLAHGWDDRAVADLGRLATTYAHDARTPLAATQRGETLFRIGRFADAGTAFEAALGAARAQGRDSLAHRAQAALPVCAYREAEASVAADSSRFGRHATLFETVATRWPDDALAPRAQYRSGIAYARAGQPREAVRVLQALVQRYPRCEFVADARLQVAKTWDGMGEREQAAQAYLDVSRNETDHESAAAAWLHAAELLAAAGQDARADELRLEYLRKYPDDVDAAMQITEAFARRELAAVDATHPVSALLATPVRPSRATRGAAPAPVSHLADYLARAKAHPALASRALVAQVRFLQGEEANAAFAAVPLNQPLAKSVAAKKRLLDTLLVRYRRSADLGVAEWAHASAFRMGEALGAFATALERSEAPADLAGDDLRSYRAVLAERARVFSTRGEDVWAEMLHHVPADAPADPWLDQARTALWSRLGGRFLFRPEVEFPLVRLEDAGRTSDATSGDAAPAADRPARALAQRERDPR